MNTRGAGLGLAGALLTDPMTFAPAGPTALSLVAPPNNVEPMIDTVAGGGLALSRATSAGVTQPQRAPAAGTAGISAERIKQLDHGAAPANAVEQQYVTQQVQALTGLLNLLQQLASESERQARLGNDVLGRPLNGMEGHAFEQRVLELVNAERRAGGLAPLAYDRQLDTASTLHNRQQIATRTMAHDGIGDGDPGARVRATGFAGAWGENVATGQTTPEQVVREWMASPGHRRNIMDPEFRRLGVAYGTAVDGRTYWAQTFGS